MKTSMTMLMAGATIIGALRMGSVAAQTQQDKPSQPELGVLEAVVVTAQKRSQDLQRVPITVTALDSRALERMQVDNVIDLAQVVPGFTVQSLAGQSLPFLRGLGFQSSGPWQEPVVSTYIDGVYYVNPNISNSVLNNVAQVEVIKGPQGTLFGRNAVGGVVSYTTVDPKHEPSVDVKFGYGNYDTSFGSLYGTTGLSENLAADIAFVAEDQRKGWGKNLYTGEDNHNAYKYSVRSKWVWTPGENTKLTWAVDYGSAQTAEVGNAAPRGVYPFITIGSAHVGGFYDTYHPDEAFNETTQYGASLKAEHDLGWAEFVSISAVRNDSTIVNTPDPFNEPYLPQAPATGQVIGLRTYTFGRQFNETGTQEFQLLSPASSTIQWVGGLYFLYNSAGYRVKNNEGVLADPAPGGGLRNDRATTRQETWSYSAFAQATAPIFTNTRLTGGVRYTTDSRNVTGYSARNSVAAPDVYALRPGTTDMDNPEPRKTWSKPTFKVAVEHDLTQETLAYLSFSTGFQSAFYSITNDANRPPLDPVTINAYEAGLKTDLFSNKLRVNTALFLYDLDNVIVSYIINNAQNQANAAKSRVKGLDLDITFMATENLTLTASLESLDPEYTNYKNSLTYVPNPATNIYNVVADDATGRQLQWTEKFVGSATASYLIPAQIGDFMLAAGYSYHSGIHYDTQDLNVQPSYSLASASIGWTSPDQRFSVKLWGKNLTNEEYVSVLQPSNISMKYVPAEPRTYGIRLGYLWK